MSEDSAWDLHALDAPQKTLSPFKHQATFRLRQGSRTCEKEHQHYFVYFIITTSYVLRFCLCHDSQLNVKLFYLLITQYSILSLFFTFYFLHFIMFFFLANQTRSTKAENLGTTAFIYEAFESQ